MSLILFNALARVMHRLFSTVDFTPDSGRIETQKEVDSKVSCRSYDISEDTD